MENQNWKYKPTREIRNFKDLEIEQQKLAIYQQFVGELIGKDKEHLKTSLQPQHLLANLLSSFTSKTGVGMSNSSAKDSNIFLKIIKWLFKTFLK